MDEMQKLVKRTISSVGAKDDNKIVITLPRAIDGHALVDRFVGHLEAYLGIKAAYNPLYYDGYHEFDDFRNEYEKKFGKPVYVGPYMRWK
ncbi:uncharacterized protein G6M90_00g093260 [Metarhizium brunneum]|uniref:Uncharacterized protein n=1 Tax=Metarhizium brunneum TaxID=500148 RepID=A0A7D5ZBN9_9HYPO|nr:hypothetical protein G6M90_00g093260 [Metarhizium brunneum]